MHVVFTKMTHDELSVLDEVRKLDEEMFASAVDYLLARGFAALTDELVDRAIGQATHALNEQKVSPDGMELLIYNMNLHITAAKIRDCGTFAVLDYIAEKGWRA